MNLVKNRTDRKTAIRMKWIFAIFLGAAALIVGRLADYQINMHEYYQSKVLNQLTIQTEVTPERGTIMDRNGNILATNKTVYNVILSPYDIKERMAENEKKNSDDNDKNDVHYEYEDAEYGISYRGDDLDDMIAQVLSKYLAVDRQIILDKSGKVNRYYEVVKNNVDSDVAENIETFIAQFDLKKQVYFEASAKRYYPKSDLACHVIGFTNSEGVGIYGLEAY